MSECPFVDRSFTPNPKFNKPLNYQDFGSAQDYVYYDHDDGFGKITRVQFCRLIGRKRDVFQCMDESEWSVCPRYRSRSVPSE